MSPVAVNGVDKQGVGINGVQVKQALNAANETVNKGVYDPTTLSAVDADLAPGNIKDSVTIFGKLGTFGALVEDVKDAEGSTALTSTGTGTFGYKETNVSEHVSLGGFSPTFTAGSLAVGSAFVNARSALANTFKLTLLMGGVVVAESAFISAAISESLAVVGTRALSGEQVIFSRLVNQDYPTSRTVFFYGYDTSSHYAGGVAVGSVKA